MTTRLFETVTAAIIGAVIALLAAVALWAWGGIADKIKKEAAILVIEQLKFSVRSSAIQPRNVQWSCEKDEHIVSAACIGINSSGHKQVSVGPDFRPDRSFNCAAYLDPNMNVQATAVCFRVK